MRRGPRAGMVVGDYALVARLAVGGMGTVFLGRQRDSTGLQPLYALKILHEHLSEDDDFVNMLHDEARMASRVRHPNVVSVVDFGESEGTHYLVMTYVEGCSLRDLLSRNLHCRPPELVAAIVIELLDGLHAAHIATDEDDKPLNLIHRDVSPENILVGTDGRTRITDFGIAKAETRMTHTLPGVRKGKYSYMSPEQVTGKPVDHRSDVFAAGTLLWNALTGMNLFRGDSDAETLQHILDRKVPRPSKVGLEPPKEFDTLCRKALKRNPDERFQTAAEMSDALRELTSNHKLVGSPHEVARWVKESFASELDELREALRRLSHDAGPDIVPSASRPPNEDDEGTPAAG